MLSLRLVALHRDEVANNLRFWQPFGGSEEEGAGPVREAPEGAGSRVDFGISLGRPLAFSRLEYGHWKGCEAYG